MELLEIKLKDIVKYIGKIKLKALLKYYFKTSDDESDEETFKKLNIWLQTSWQRFLIQKVLPYIPLW